MAELVAREAVGYADAHTSPFAGTLASVAAWTKDNTSSPAMMSGLAEARLLEALIVVGGARSVLEIGTFTGLGALTKWLDDGLSELAGRDGASMPKSILILELEALSFLTQDLAESVLLQGIFGLLRKDS